MVLLDSFWQTKTGICRRNMVPAQKKACGEIRKNTENWNQDGIGRPNI